MELRRTVTLLKAIAADAIMGLSKIPYEGNRTPAATGIAKRL
jgi:hypothetical protein